MSDKKGYFRQCKFCGDRIWMLNCHDGRWRPFNPPADKNSQDWKIHSCQTNSALTILRGSA